MSSRVNHQGPSFLYDETFKQATKGATLGAGIVAIVAPLLYFKNMKQTKQPIVLRHCYRGAPVMAFNVVPQTAITLGANSLIKKHFFHKDDGEDFSTNEKLIAATTAGAIAGIASAPCEFVVQNYQNKWRNSITQVVRSAFMEKGPAVFMRGASFLALREGIYAPGYLVLTKIFSDMFKPHIKNEYAADGAGALAAGAIVGAVTSPPDILRANKQWMTRNWSARDTQRNLAQKVMEKGVKSRNRAVVIAMMSGATARMAAVSVANFIMVVFTKEKKDK